MASCLLELRDLKVERGGVPVLDVPSFRVHEEEFVSLIGPNGSGKSTLLLSIMCLLPRSSGRIVFKGKEIGSDRDALEFRRKIAMVLQDPLLFDTTVYENVASGLRLRGVERAERRRRVMTYLERFNLAHMADRSARKLSGGEARRVSLARASVIEPDLLFLDEPFANLDPPTRHSIAEDLEKTIRDTGMAAVFVTHDQADALRLSDRIAVMSGGCIVQADAPAAVMQSPANEFVANWVGMETILDGVIRRNAGKTLRIDVAGREIDAVGQGVQGGRVFCCVRPEHVRIDLRDSGSSSERNVFPGRIVSVASMGPFVKISLDCGFPLVSYVTPESFAALGLDGKKEVFASFKATSVHLIHRVGRRERATTSPG